jgi:hypothetical protein
MKRYTITLTLSVDADNEKQAMNIWGNRVIEGDFDHNSIEVEEE